MRILQTTKGLQILNLRIKLEEMKVVNNILNDFPYLYLLKNILFNNQETLHELDY